MKYKTKPHVKEALQLTGTDENMAELEKFITVPFDRYADGEGKIFKISFSALEGQLFCYVGDYVIKGMKGEYYPCKADIFEMTYEKVKD